jgi:hypothetical protein
MQLLGMIAVGLDWSESSESSEMEIDPGDLIFMR